jgi:hypothetical protein
MVKMNNWQEGYRFASVPTLSLTGMAYISGKRVSNIKLNLTDHNRQFNLSKLITIVPVYFALQKLAVH